MQSDISQTVEDYNLPELPEEYDGTGERDLILFLHHEPNVLLTRYRYGVTLDDARDYCSRDDTSGDGWFVGFDRADSTPEPPYGDPVPDLLS